MRTRKPKRFYLYANLSQINLSVSDLSMLNGKKKIAMLENSMHEAQFQKWEKKHGVKTEHVYISDFEDSLKRLQNGEVDGVLSSETPDWGKAGVSAVVLIGIFLVVLFIVLIFLRKAKKAANEAVELNKRLAEKQRDLEKALVQAESANEAKTTSLSFQAEADGLTITGEHDDYTGVNVWSNALYLKKILMNLFSNSMKYNKPNGSISMSMRTVERTEECITCEFKIQDTGVGMSEEFIQKRLVYSFCAGGSIRTFQLSRNRSWYADC